MSLRKRAGAWHYRFQVHGHTYSGSTGFTASKRNESAAQREEAKARELIATGKADLLRVEAKPFTEAVEAFIAWARAEHADKPETSRRLHGSSASLKFFFGRLPVHNLTPGKIEDYKTWRRNEGLKEITIRHDLHMLSAFVRYARKQLWIQVNPLEDVDIPSAAGAERMYILTAAEEQRYFQTCLDRGFQDLHDLGRLMIRQGCRPGELLTLERSAVDLEKATLRIRNGKTVAAKRSLRLVDESRSILAPRLANDTTRWVFPSPKRPGEHLLRFDEAHNKVLEPIGLQFVVYDLRHTFATRMAERGMPLPTLAAILGHANIRSVMRYVHPTQSHQEEAMLRYGEEAQQPVDDPRVIQ